MPASLKHPTPAELAAYSLGQLSEDEAVAIDQHIGDCEPCCETIVGLSADDTFLNLLKDAKRVPSDQTVEQSHTTQSSGPPAIPAGLQDHPRYEIVGLIGKGGMGDVYRARHRKMERTVALKVINRELVQKRDAVDRFHREVKAAAQLTHPNIVTAYDADQAGDFHFMVMEYVDGVDLSQKVKEQKALPIADACDYVRQAATGLQHAHERGMVHRDIKPHNLMVTADGTVKILDFGLASLAPEPISNTGSPQLRSDLTEVGTIMGTPDFISPEQAIDAREVDIRSDIYSLGATLYYLLAGRAPFAEGSIVDKLKCLSESEPLSLNTFRDDLPVELIEIVERMLAKNPDDRFQSPDDVAEALATFSVAAETTEDSQLQTKAKAERRQPPVKRFTAVAALFFATLAATIFFVQTNNGVVRVEVLDDSLAVVIKDQTITVDNDNRPITISPGEQTLVVRYTDGDIEFETNSFQIRRGDEIAFKVELLKGEIVVSKNGAAFDRSGAKVLVGEWRGKIGGSDEELRVAFQSDGSFELVISNPTKVEVRTMGTYRTDFSVAPAHLDLNATILKGPLPGTGSRYDTPRGETPTEFSPERERPVQQKVEAIIELVDANTLRISDLDADTRPQSFEGNTVVLRRQGTIRDAPANTDGGADPFDRSVPSSTLELSDDVMRNFITSRGQFASFERDLYATISRSAGIPNDQWAKFASTANASTDAIKGTPLSWVLLMQKASDDESAAIRMLTEKPAPMRDIQEAMSPSQPNGYVSLIQPQYITKTKLGINRESTEFRGTAWFEVPGLYAGKFDFTMLYHVGQLKITKFALPELGIELVRNDSGEYIQKSSAGKSIKGHWIQVSAKQGGRALAGTDVGSTTLTLDDNSYTFTMRNAEGGLLKQRSGSFKIDASKSPMTCDFIDDKRTGDQMNGICEIDGDTLRMCLVERESASDALTRPTEFASPAGSEMILWEFERAENARDQQDIHFDTKKSVSEVQAAIREYYIDKYPLFAAAVNERSNVVSDPEKLLDRETRRQIGELAVNSPVSEVVNSLAGGPWVTFSEATQLSHNEALITRVNLHSGIDNTCRIHVSRHPRKYLKPNETYAISEPISEEELRQLIGSKEPKTSDQERIQGAWQLTYMEENGDTPSYELMRQMKVVFEGDRLTTEGGYQDRIRAHFSIDPSTKPASIDWVDEEGGKKLGIYDLQGDTLRICFANEKVGVRPQEFASDQNGVWLFRLERVTEEIDLPEQVISPEVNSLIWIDAKAMTSELVDQSLASLIDALPRNDRERAEGSIAGARAQVRATFDEWQKAVEAGMETIVIAGQPKYAEAAGEDMEDAVKAEMEGAEDGQFFLRMRPGTNPQQAVEIMTAALLKAAEIAPDSEEAREFEKAKPTGFVDAGDGWFAAEGKNMLPLPAKEDALDTTPFAQAMGNHPGAVIRMAWLMSDAERFEMDMKQLEAGAMFFGGLMTSLRDMQSTTAGVWLGERPKVVVNMQFDDEENAKQFKATLDKMVGFGGLLLAFGSDESDDPEEALKMEQTKAALTLLFLDRDGANLSKTFDIGLLQQLGTAGLPWTSVFESEAAELGDDAKAMGNSLQSKPGNLD